MSSIMAQLGYLDSGGAVITSSKINNPALGILGTTIDFASTGSDRTDLRKHHYEQKKKKAHSETGRADCPAPAAGGAAPRAGG